MTTLSRDILEEFEKGLFIVRRKEAIPFGLVFHQIYRTDINGESQRFEWFNTW